MNDGSLQAIFQAAQAALKNDARQVLASGSQARQQQFRMINNQANSRHMLFSGAPKAAQMQYDQNTFIPNMASSVVQSITKQAENQESWDKFASGIKELNEYSAELEKATPK